MKCLRWVDYFLQNTVAEKLVFFSDIIGGKGNKFQMR